MCINEDINLELNEKFYGQWTYIIRGKRNPVEAQSYSIF